MASDGREVPPLKTDTFTRAMKDLLALGLVDGDRVNGHEALWWQAGKAMADDLRLTEPVVR